MTCADIRGSQRRRHFAVSAGPGLIPFDIECKTSKLVDLGSPARLRHVAAPECPWWLPNATATRSRHRSVWLSCTAGDAAVERECTVESLHCSSLAEAVEKVIMATPDGSGTGSRTAPTTSAG